MIARRQDIFDADFLKSLEQLHLLAKRLSARYAGGINRSRRIGDGLEFADHRDYSPGDEIRFIDWACYARMERLLVRLFHQQAQGGVMIMLDASASMAGAKFDYARRTAAALAYVAMGSMERVTLQPYAQECARPLTTSRDRSRIIGVLDYLAAIEPSGKTDLAHCTRHVAAAPGQTTVMLISDLLDSQQDLSDAMSRLRQKSQPTVVHLVSPHDAEPALAGPLTLRQVETGQEMNLDVTADLLADYRQAFAGFRDGCRKSTLARGANYIEAPIDLPFEKLVLGALRQAGVVG